MMELLLEYCLTVKLSATDRIIIQPVQLLIRQKHQAINPHEEGQGLSDPVQLMRILAENCQNQQISLNQSSTNASSQVLSAISFSISNDSSIAAVCAAQASMSVGVGGFRPTRGNTNLHKNQMHSDSLYNSTTSRTISHRFSCFGGMHVQPDRIRISSPFHAFVPHGLVPIRVGNEIHFHNQRMAYQNLSIADLSRSPLQSTWWNLNPQMPSRQKQESQLAPDLNIDF